MKGAPDGEVLIPGTRPAVVQTISVAVSEGSSVLLTGEEGIGKTRVLGAVVSNLRRNGERVLSLSATHGHTRLPFGAFLSLSDDVGISGEDDYLRLSMSSLHEAGGRLATRAARLGVDVIVIDDAHRLDSYSAGLILEFARAGMRVVATATSPRDLPAALQEVSRDRMRRFTLEPLDEACAVAMLQDLLGAQPDPVLANVFVTAARGVPLHLSELVSAARDTGALRRDGRGWSLDGAAHEQPSLVDAVRMRLMSLSAPARRSLEAVAVAEPVITEVVDAVAGRHRLDELTVAGLVVVDPSGWVRTSHSLVRRTIIADLPRLRRRSIVLRLIDELDTRDRLDQLRDAEQIARAMLRAEVGRPQPLAEVLSLADLVAESDPSTAELLLLTAVEDPSGRPAVLRLAQLYAHQHRSSEATALLEAITRTASSADEGIAANATHAFLLAQPLNSPAAALRVLDTAEANHGPSVSFDVVRSTALWRSGSLDASLAISVRLSEDESLPPHVRAHAALDRQAVATESGAPADLATAMKLAARLAPLAGSALPEADVSQQLLSAQGYLLAVGDLDAAQAIISKGSDRALVSGDAGVRLQWVNEQGWLLYLRGRIDEAVEMLDDARTAKGLWAAIMHTWVGANHIRALVAAGSVERAAELLGDVRRAPRTVLYDTDVALAEAAILAGRGLEPLAARVCTLAARAAERRGIGMMALLAWYEGVLLGDGLAAKGLLRMFTSHPALLERPRNRALGSHAKAVATNDRAALATAAAELRATGHAHYADSIDRPTRDSTPAAPLTDREAQLALLAASGTSDRHIGEMLGVSMRTVGTHLSRVYAKLGISGRAQLLLQPGRSR